jgi:hypothetical protein
MRAFAILVAAAAIYSGTQDPVVAQTSTPNVTVPFTGLSTPLTSTTTNCMMFCNSQAANCQTTCFIPPPPTTTPAGTVTLNATANTACVMGCTSSQLACQTNCALAAPSR